MAKVTKAEKRMATAVKRATEGNADDLHELLKHEKRAFGSAYEAISNAYDLLDPDEMNPDAMEESVDQALGLLEDAMASLREMIIDAERTD